MTRHYAEELQDALDGRLAAARRAEVDEHMATCPACAGVYARLRDAKQAVAGLERPPLPGPLLDRLAATLDREDRSSPPAASTAPAATETRLRSPRRAPWWALPLAAALLLAAGTAAWRSRPLPVEGVAAVLGTDFGRYQRGALPLTASTSDIGQLEAFFSAADLAFPVRVLDLGMMGYQPVGGGIVDVDGQRAALLVYRSAAGVVLCTMYPGDAAANRRGATVRTRAGIDFFVHRIGAITVVLWQEGAITCALVGDGDPQGVVDLALAKAMKPA